jgi:endonuclease YncB( thermonuclease family)
MANTIPPPQYPLLRDHIEGILTEGKVHSRRTGEWAKVEAYWHVGDALTGHFRDHPRAEYGQQTVRNLSQDLNLSESLLWDILLFRRSLPILYSSRELGWTHVRAVLRLPTQDQRYYYLKAADQGSWTTRQLRAAIRDNAFGQHTEQPWAVPPEQDPQQGQPLRARFGDLYTYKMVPAGDLAAPDPFVDLGFGITCRARAAGLPEAQPGQVVTVTQDSGTRTVTIRPPDTRRYTYTAWVQRVIDGDTLIAIVDLGLDHQTRPQRFRLRGIDCPELGTQAGRNAKAFTQKALGQVGFIVLTTHRTDSYGRYLADIRYLPGQSQPEIVRQRGSYLNRELLDRRLAQRYVR